MGCKTRTLFIGSPPAACCPISPSLHRYISDWLESASAEADSSQRVLVQEIDKHMKLLEMRAVLMALTAF